jgi:hypothetical protein
MIKKIFTKPPVHQQESSFDILAAPPEQSGRSIQLSEMKRRLNQIDGDEHPKEHPSTIGPFKDMYIAIKELSCCPFGNIFHNGRVTLITNTQENRR